MNSIFVKIPRTATASINQILKQYRGHATAKHWIKKVGQDKWDEAFTFSVVRNPYTRFVSSFHHSEVKGDINDFVYNLNVPEHFKVVFKPQYLFLYDGNKLLVDKVYKFENLSKAWDDISERLGNKKRLPHLHKTENKQILNERSKKLISKYYKEDFERFNYDT